MGVTITHAGGVVTPTLILGFQSSRAGGNIVHRIPGRRDPDITLRPAGLRTGTLELFFAEEAESREAEDIHAAGSVFGLSSDDRTSVEMFYVVSGTIARELDPQTRKRWTVRVDFQEVAPS